MTAALRWPASRAREVLIDHATREAQVTYTVEHGAAGPHGAGALLGHREGRHDLPAAPRAVRAGRPVHAGQGQRAARPPHLARRVQLGARQGRPRRSIANGELPIDVELTDRPPRTIGFGASYETRLGFAVNGYWLHRNLFGEAESLRLSAEVNHIGEGAIPADLGYGFKADFRKPDWWLKQQDATSMPPR